MIITSTQEDSAISARDQRIEELIRVMPLIWRRAKPDPSQLGPNCPGPLSSSECRVLFHLALFERDNAGIMAEKIDLSRPATTEAVDRLVEKGMVLRQSCPDDRRKVQLVLTPAAIDISRQFVDRWRAGFGAALDRLTNEEQMAFHKGMFALADTLGEQEVSGSV